MVVTSKFYQEAKQYTDPSFLKQTLMYITGISNFQSSIQEFKEGQDRDAIKNLVEGTFTMTMDVFAITSIAGLLTVKLSEYAGFQYFMKQIRLSQDVVEKTSRGALTITSKLGAIGQIVGGGNKIVSTLTNIKGSSGESKGQVISQDLQGIGVGTAQIFLGSKMYSLMNTERDEILENADKTLKTRVFQKKLPIMKQNIDTLNKSLYQFSKLTMALGVEQLAFGATEEFAFHQTEVGQMYMVSGLSSTVSGTFGLLFPANLYPTIQTFDPNPVSIAAT